MRNARKHKTLENDGAFKLSSETVVAQLGMGRLVVLCFCVLRGGGVGGRRVIMYVPSGTQVSDSLLGGGAGVSCFVLCFCHMTHS